MPMPHIQVRDVSLTYDTPAGRVAGVQAASFDIDQSEFLCIVGPSGCGKSTLLNLIAGFLQPTGGEIRIGGKKVNGHGLDRVSCSRISRSFSRGALRSAM